MRRIALALSLALALSGVAAAEFVAREKDFIAGSCQSCHAAARSYDFVCEGHAVASLGLSEETIRALQHDPRCASAP